jgi:replicative DNA helicase
MTKRPPPRSCSKKPEAELFSVSDQSLKQDLVSIESVFTESFDRIEELHRNKGALRGIRTGYRDLDDKTAGLQRSDLIILAARPAMGKTTLRHQPRLQRRDHRQASGPVFSLEMSKEQLVDRMLSDASGVNSWNIRTGNLSDDDFAKISEAMGEMAEAPISILMTRQASPYSRCALRPAGPHTTSRSDSSS